MLVCSGSVVLVCSGSVVVVVYIGVAIDILRWWWWYVYCDGVEVYRCIDIGEGLL